MSADKRNGSRRSTERPYVMMYNAVSADGRITGFEVDLGLYYGLTTDWRVDAVLCGSETILAAEGPGDEKEDMKVKVEEKPPGLPLFVVPDSRGRVRHWNALRNAPYWDDVLVLCSASTPTEYLKYLREASVQHLVVGEKKVDLSLALRTLRVDFGVKKLRIDSGGSLNGALLALGLVDEIHLLVHPCMVGGTEPKTVFTAKTQSGLIDLCLVHAKKIGEDLIWLKYKVESSRARED